MPAGLIYKSISFSLMGGRYEQPPPPEQQPRKNAGQNTNSAPGDFPGALFSCPKPGGKENTMEIFVYIITATGAATLAALFVRLLDRIDQPRKR